MEPRALVFGSGIILTVWGAWLALIKYRKRGLAKMEGDLAQEKRHGQYMMLGLWICLIGIMMVFVS